MNETPDTKPETKDEALQRRREELEDELERFAKAGVPSPGLVKAARWLSRGLWLAMTAVVVFLLFSGYGKVSQEKFDEATKAITAWEAANKKLKSELDTTQEKMGELMIEAATRESELRALREGPEAAALATSRAYDLSARFWGDITWSAQWPERLARAEPEAHGVDPTEGVIAILKQAAYAALPMQNELVRETTDFGLDGSLKGAARCLVDADPKVRVQGAMLLARLQGNADDPGFAAAISAEKDPVALRGLLYAESLYLRIRMKADAAPTRFEPEYLLRYTFLRVDGVADSLEQAYRGAPAEHRLDCLAMLALHAGRTHSKVFGQVARSTDRPVAERLLAVRWIAARGDDEARQVLKGLAAGKDVIGQEAAQALESRG